jgi:hypothetical protein
MKPMSDDNSIDRIINLYRKDLDKTLLQRNLKLTVEERFLQAMELQRFADELRKNAGNLKGSGPREPVAPDKKNS